MCQVIMKKYLRLVDNTIILIKHFNLYFLLICLFVYWTVRSYENGLSRYLNAFFLPHVAPVEANHRTSPERWSISYTTAMFTQAECKHVPIWLKYKESTTTIPEKSAWPAAFCFFVFNALSFVQRILLSSSEPSVVALLDSDPACFSFIDDVDNRLFAFRPIFSSASFSSTF